MCLLCFVMLVEMGEQIVAWSLVLDLSEMRKRVGTV